MPFLWPQFFWWAACIFLIPLFYLIIHDKVTIFHGVIWSGIAFSLQFWAIAEGLYCCGSGNIFFKLIPPVLVLLVAYCYGLSWFFLLISLRFITQSPGVRLFCAAIFTWLFFLFLERGSLFMLGAVEGYLLFNPLVPLVEYSGMLFWLPKIGSSLLLFIFIATQAFISAAICWGRYYWLAVLFFVGVWLMGIIISHTHRAHIINHTTIACGREYFNAHDSVMHTGRAIRDYCKALLKQYPESDMILFHETAIRCPILPGEPQVVALLNQEQLGKSVTILTGGFRWDNGKYRNTVYWIHDGVLIDLFDKRHAMALTERGAHAYFFKNFIGIHPSTRRRPFWQITKNLKIVPYICSELFFNTYPDHELQQNTSIIAFCNDSWLKRDYMRYQMLMCARYRAIQWQVPILYVAHFYHALCGMHGEYQPVKVFDHTQQN